MPSEFSTWNLTRLRLKALASRGRYETRNFLLFQLFENKVIDFEEFDVLWNCTEHVSEIEHYFEICR